MDFIMYWSAQVILSFASVKMGLKRTPWNFIVCFLVPNYFFALCFHSVVKSHLWLEVVHAMITLVREIMRKMGLLGYRKQALFVFISLSDSLNYLNTCF